MQHQSWFSDRYLLKATWFSDLPTAPKWVILRKPGSSWQDSPSPSADVLPLKEWGSSWARTPRIQRRTHGRCLNWINSTHSPCLAQWWGIIKICKLELCKRTSVIKKNYTKHYLLESFQLYLKDSYNTNIICNLQ